MDWGAGLHHGPSTATRGMYHYQLFPSHQNHFKNSGIGITGQNNLPTLNQLTSHNTFLCLTPNHMSLLFITTLLPWHYWLVPSSPLLSSAVCQLIPGSAASHPLWSVGFYPAAQSLVLWGLLASTHVQGPVSWLHYPLLLRWLILVKHKSLLSYHF